MKRNKRNYVFTNYIYPISTPVTLLEKYGLSFDNPRSKKEIEDVKILITKSINDKYAYMYKTGKKQKDKKFYFEKNIDKIILGDKHSEFLFNPFPKDDLYINSIFKSMLGSNLVDVLSKIWVIIRFDENTPSKVYSQLNETIMQAKKRDTYDQLGDPIDIIRDRLIDLEAMAALIYWNGDTAISPGDTFIMDDISFNSRFDSDSKNHFMLYIFLHRISQIEDRYFRGIELYPFHKSMLKWCSIFKGINDALSEDNENKILFLSNLLKVATDDGLNEKAKYLLLTSVIEMLLTHSPDHRRYNIEESINKQFILKTASVIYQNDKSFILNDLKSSLKHIYEIRSLIAHGNFKGLLKFGSLDSSAESLEYYIFNLCDTIYIYIKKVLEEYFKDRNYIDFIKEN